MESFQQTMNEYKKQLEKGIVQQAYKGLMEYIMGLRTHFMKKYPDYEVPGNIYFGYMDMTYFSIVPKSFQQRKLKIAVVFIHGTCRFEAWLAGINKQVQEKYWKLIKDSGWNQYQVVPSTKGADAIIVHTLEGNPDFEDLDALTKKIEEETLTYIKTIEAFFSKNKIDLS